jgi:hypothetical protein
VEYDDYVAIAGLGETTSGQHDIYGIIADFIFRAPETRLVIVIGIENGEEIRVSIRANLELIQTGDFLKRVFEEESETDTGKATAGAKKGSGGATVPLSRREREEWAVADENQKMVLFNLKLKRYKQRIKQILDS